MDVKFSQKWHGSKVFLPRVLLLNTLVVSSALLGSAAYAETQSNQTNAGFTNDANLIKAISTDPMTMIPAKDQPKLTGESAIVQQINQEQVSRPASHLLSPSHIK